MKLACRIIGSVGSVVHAYHILLGGFNPSEKYQSKWESSPNRGENKKYLKPPPRYHIPFISKNPGRFHIPTSGSRLQSRWFRNPAENSPLQVGSEHPIIYRVLLTSQVAVWDIFHRIFWFKYVRRTEQRQKSQKTPNSHLLKFEILVS